MKIRKAKKKTVGVPMTPQHLKMVDEIKAGRHLTSRTDVMRQLVIEAHRREVTA